MVHLRAPTSTRPEVIWGLWDHTRRSERLLCPPEAAVRDLTCVTCQRTIRGGVAEVEDKYWGAAQLSFLFSSWSSGSPTGTIDITAITSNTCDKAFETLHDQHA